MAGSRCGDKDTPGGRRSRDYEENRINRPTAKPKEQPSTKSQNSNNASAIRLLRADVPTLQ